MSLETISPPMLLLLVGVVAFFSGVGIVCCFVGDRSRHGVLLVPLCLSFGLANIGYFSLYVVRYNLKIQDAVWLALGFSALPMAVGILTLRQQFLKRISTHGLAVARCWPEILGTLVLAVAMISPGLRGGVPQPFRIGVDEAGYAQTGQYLMDGGTAKSLGRDIIRLTGQPKLTYALNANITVLDFEKSTASEFLLKSMRIGYPAMLAAVLKVVGIHYVIDGQFLMLLFPAWMLLALMFVFLEVDLGVSAAVVWLGVVATTLNSNILNVAFEGQHGQFAGMPFLALLFVLLYRVRGRAAKASLFDWRKSAPELILATLAFCAMASYYSEFIVAVGAVGALILMADVVLRRGLPNPGAIWFSLACAGGMALTGPYALDWFPFILKHVTNISAGGAGFPQPQWAMPVDILGYIDIYQPAVPRLISRDTGELIVLGMISLAVVEATLYVLLNEESVDLAYWAAPAVFVAVIFCDVYFLKRIGNYAYMKVYTSLTFPLISLHLLTLDRLSRWRSIKGTRPLRLIMYVPLLICIAGIGYLSRYNRQAEYLPKSIADLVALDHRIHLRDYPIVTSSGTGIKGMIIPSIVPFNWLNLGWADPYLLPYEGRNILYIGFKKDIAFPKQIAAMNRASVILDDDDFLVISTNFKIEVPEVQRATHIYDKLTKQIKWPLNMTPEWQQIIDRVEVLPNDRNPG